MLDVVHQTGRAVRFPQQDSQQAIHQNVGAVPGGALTEQNLAFVQGQPPAQRLDLFHLAEVHSAELGRQN